MTDIYHDLRITFDAMPPEHRRNGVITHIQKNVPADQLVATLCRTVEGHPDTAISEILIEHLSRLTEHAAVLVRWALAQPGDNGTIVRTLGRGVVHMFTPEECWFVRGETLSRKHFQMFVCGCSAGIRHDVLPFHAFAGRRLPEIYQAVDAALKHSHPAVRDLGERCIREMVPVLMPAFGTEVIASKILLLGAKLFDQAQSVAILEMTGFHSVAICQMIRGGNSFGCDSRITDSLAALAMSLAATLDEHRNRASASTWLPAGVIEDLVPTYVPPPMSVKLEKEESKDETLEGLVEQEEEEEEETKDSSRATRSKRGRSEEETASEAKRGRRGGHRG